MSDVNEAKNDVNGMNCACTNGSKSSTAKKRWKILSESLIKHKIGRPSTANMDVSVRRFKGFGVVSYEKIDADDLGVWFTISSGNSETAKIRLLFARIDPSVLIGFNNTGNVCIWPAEEIMTYHCMKRKHNFRGKRICELGGGMTALAGLMLAVNVEADTILLTDGNEESAQTTYIQKIVERNQDKFLTKKVTSRQLIWGRMNDCDNEEKYDFVICADCLFFIEYQQDLVKTLWNILEDQGEAILLAPRRGESFNLFVELASSLFHVIITENFDVEIWKKHEFNLKNEPTYDANIHYPFLILLKKKTS